MTRSSPVDARRAARRCLLPPILHTNFWRDRAAAGVREQRSRREVALATAEGRRALEWPMPAARSRLERLPLFQSWRHSGITANAAHAALDYRRIPGIAAQVPPLFRDLCGSVGTRAVERFRAARVAMGPDGRCTCHYLGVGQPACALAGPDLFDRRVRRPDRRQLVLIWRSRSCRWIGILAAGAAWNWRS
jgi:hypothetical protein